MSACQTVESQVRLHFPGDLPLHSTGDPQSSVHPQAACPGTMDKVCRGSYELHSVPALPTRGRRATPPSSLYPEVSRPRSLTSPLLGYVAPSPIIVRGPPPARCWSFSSPPIRPPRSLRFLHRSISSLFMRRQIASGRV
jgi:hypothetical protein